MFSSTYLVSKIIDRELKNEANFFLQTITREDYSFEDEITTGSDLIPDRSTDAIVIEKETKNIVYLKLFQEGEYLQKYESYLRKKFDDYEEEGFDPTKPNSLNEESHSFNMGGYRSYLTELDFKGKKYYLIIFKDTGIVGSLWHMFFYVFVIVFGVIFVSYLFVANNAAETVLKGVDEITEFAKSLKRNNYSERVRGTYGNNKVDNLVGTFNKMLDRIEENFRQIEDFTGNVSHELKTPIMSMKSMIEIELTKDRSKEEYQETLGKVLEEVNWLNKIIHNLLLLTKEPKKLVDNFHEVDVSEMLETACEFLEFVAMDQDISLNYNIEGIRKKKVNGTETLLMELFTNLINNAIKYNKENGSVTVETKSEDEKLYISVTDTGIGIKEENISRITERFFREDKVRTTKISGSGLGLSLVKHIIKMHGGTLEIESKLGEGSTFRVILPELKEKPPED